MKLTKYQKFLYHEDVYGFVSRGKQGDIYKGVLFQHMAEPNNPHRFNLAMGDINLKTGEMEFEYLSGNGDARKVFATIGDIVQDYTDQHPGREIFVAGNTDEKKRTYSFMTSRYLEEIKEDFEVWGADKGGEFEHFEKDKVYDAILVRRK